MLNGILQNEDGSFFRLILDHVSDCLVVVDTGGSILFINQPYCSLLGGVATDFIGRHVTDAISKESRLHKIANGDIANFLGRLTVHGQSLIIKQVPIKSEGELVGAVGMALFNDQDQLLRLSKKVGIRDVSLPANRSRGKRLYVVGDIFGSCSEVAKLRLDIERYAPLESTVLIYGETGVGKELVAQAMHTSSQRADEPFIAVNCATIPSELIEAELFGYEGGAFTGSRTSGGLGKFEAAGSGTVFLDEIGDMPFSLQAKLLRVLQEREIVRVGGTRAIPVRARIVCATHRNLRRQIERESFREDLYYRISTIGLVVPPLRARSDIGPLSHFLIQRVCRNNGRPAMTLSKVALRQIAQYSWPGNVRELMSALERSVIVADDDVKVLDRVDIHPIDEHPADRLNEQSGIGIWDTLQGVELQTIEKAIAASDGRVSQAAKDLGMNRATLYKKIDKYGIKVGRQRRFNEPGIVQPPLGKV